jgi:hypothetical protein
MMVTSPDDYVRYVRRSKGIATEIEVKKDAAGNVLAAMVSDPRPGGGGAQLGVLIWLVGATIAFNLINFAPLTLVDQKL